VIAATLFCAGLVYAAVRLDGPTGAFDRALDAFHRDPEATPDDLSGRLLSVSGHGRADYWRVAAGMVADHPLLGAGAATFNRNWLADRPVPHQARDAHNLYLETVAALGPIGLAVLLLALAPPLVAFGRVRGDPVGAALAGVYAAFLVHAAVDWDWEIPLLALGGLVCGTGLVARGRVPGGPTAVRLPGPLVVGLGCCVVAIGLAAHIGNRALASAQHELATGRPERALARARTARTWMPWSAEPWQLIGQAHLAAGRDAKARASLLEAARRDPGAWSTWLSLASITPSSEAALARAEALNPLSSTVSEVREATRTDP